MFPVGVYNVEDYPLNWIDGTYYSTYKDNTFQVSGTENVKSDAEYDAVTSINLNNQSLNTDFTNTLLSKFKNLLTLQCNTNNILILDVSSLTSLTNLNCFGNNIAILDVSLLTNLTDLICSNNNISVLDVSALTNLTYLNCFNNNISTLDVSLLTNLTYLNYSTNNIGTLDVTMLVNLTDLNCSNNNASALDVSTLTSLIYLSCNNNQLDAATNSQLLIDLDSHGLSNGYFNGSIFGGGSLTAAGQTAKTNLLSKGWTILGV